MSDQSAKLIAVEAADLDHARIDGTRIYLREILKRLGKASPSDTFLIYHRNVFNSELQPPERENYRMKIVRNFPGWVFTFFSLSIWRDKAEILWMPIQALPFIRRKKIKTVVTIHDLAFRYFPETFPFWDRLKLRMFSRYAIKHADVLLAVSDSTKQDILKFYPKTAEQKIQVVHHGIEKESFSDLDQKTIDDVLGRWTLEKGKYILYVGAIQPRKNLEILIEAFERIKKNGFPGKLVLSGEEAWLSQKTIKKAKSSLFSDSIIITGKLKFNDLSALYQGGGVFVLPSKYEGFGLPILEAMASKLPVIVAENSSLKEVGGSAACYFKTDDAEDLANKIQAVFFDEEAKQKMINLGLERIELFSWDRTVEKMKAIFDQLN